MNGSAETRNRTPTERRFERRHSRLFKQTSRLVLGSRFLLDQFTGRPLRRMSLCASFILLGLFRFPITVLFVVCHGIASSASGSPAQPKCRRQFYHACGESDMDWETQGTPKSLGPCPCGFDHVVRTIIPVSPHLPLATGLDPSTLSVTCDGWRVF